MEPWRSEPLASLGLLGAGTLATRLCPSGPSVCLRHHTTVRSGSRGAQSLSRHCERLGALVLRAFYVTARSWEPWCSEMFTLPLALGGLGVESLLRHHSLLGASVLIIVYVTVRSWEP